MMSAVGTPFLIPGKTVRVQVSSPDSLPNFGRPVARKEPDTPRKNHRNILFSEIYEAIGKARGTREQRQQGSRQRLLLHLQEHHTAAPMGHRRMRCEV